MYLIHNLSYRWNIQIQDTSTNLHVDLNAPKKKKKKTDIPDVSDALLMPDVPDVFFSAISTRYSSAADVPGVFINT